MTEQGAVVLKGPGAFVVSSEDYATVAESLMKRYSEQKDFKWLTTTKLRGIYSLVMNVYVRVNMPEEYERFKPDIQYLKVRMAYEAGRERSVKTFLSMTHLMDLVDAIASFEQFRLYCRYAEALVAYFKFFGGRDK